MTRFSSRALAGAAITVLLGSFAILPAAADPVVPVAPVVTWTTEITDGQTFPYGSVPASPTCTAVQDTTPVACVVSGYGTTVGAWTLVPMVGEPAVAATPTVGYTVTATWTLKGYGVLAASKAGVWNKAKAGSTIPLKFKIYDGDGDKSKSKKDIAAFGALQVSCVDGSAVVNPKSVDLLNVTRKGFALKYRNGAFHENWKTTKALKATVKVKGKKVPVLTCYQVTMTAVDGQSLTALFKLK